MDQYKIQDYFKFIKLIKLIKAIINLVIYTVDD